jgi:hypothetical protein
MSLTLLCSETFPMEWWNAAMPGVRVTEVVPGAAARASRDSEAVGALLKVLEGLPQDHAAISSKTLKLAAGLASMTPKAFSRLLSRLVTAGIPGWQAGARGLVRAARIEFAPVAGGYVAAD